MCGIAGIIRKDGLPVEEEILHRMSDAMRERGPDGEGFFVQGPLALVHRRLSIIDLEGGAQPIANEDNSILIVVNGEIYNYRDLTRSLMLKGHRFRTHSDSECVLHAYEEYGDSFPEHLEGMFALAILDLRKNKLLLARDRAGQKPLFYYSDGRLFAFASEMNALKQISGVELELDRKALGSYLTYMYYPCGSTVYRNVRKLPPGTLLVLGQDREPVIREYWSSSFVEQERSPLEYESAAEHLYELVTESVRSHLIADVPLGVFLSGGLDSTIIAYAASRIPSPSPLKCFSIGFEDPAYDESAQARRNYECIRALADRKVEFHHKIVRPDDFGVLEKLLSHCGEPYADSSILPTHLLCRFAREQVTVALSGDGADELFGGYERYLAMRTLGRVDFLSEPCRRLLFGSAAKLLPSSGGDRTAPARLKRFLIAASRSASGRYLSILAPFTSKEKRELCLFDFTGEADPMKAFFDSYPPVRAAEQFDFRNYLPDDILVKTDRASMAVSLEVRAPFLDRPVVEFAMSLPESFKMLGVRRKRILADAFRGRYPEGLDTMRKRGFGIPLASWFRTAWKASLHSYLLEGKGVNEFGLFRRELVERWIREHCSGHADHSKKLYTLLAFELAMK